MMGTRLYRRPRRARSTGSPKCLMTRWCRKVFEGLEITFGPDLVVITHSSTGELVKFTSKSEGRILTITSEREDFTVTFDQTDQTAMAEGVQAVVAYVRRVIPPSRVLQ